MSLLRQTLEPTPPQLPPDAEDRPRTTPGTKTIPQGEDDPESDYDSQTLDEP